VDHSTDVGGDEPAGTTKDDRWRIAKIPATIIIVATIQLGTALWWGGGVTEKLAEHERRLTAVELSIVQLQAQLNQVLISVANVAQKVDGIGRQLDVIQDRIPPPHH